ncbi:MAG: peptide chain release factor 1, partial [Proteobacteria bacterium]|nr:peptide chain release factor 1 [Pseudomonadota bacterium]
MIPDGRIEQLLDRYDFLQHQLADPAALGSEKFVAVSKEFSDLGPVVEGAEALKALRR